MRKEAKAINRVEVQTVVGYHCSRFQGVKLFTSDRPKKLAGFDELNEIGRTKAFIGQEVEVEFDSTANESIKCEVLQKVVFSHFPADMWRVERDGSLRNGAECVTQVMTKAFIRNNYKNFQLMYNTYFPAFGISAIRTGNCGMHCNLSLGCFGKDKETQDENIRKLHYFINHNYTLACGLFNRNASHTGYCGRMDYSDSKHLDLNRLANDNNHYVCINYGHYNNGRIELRLVGGQSNYACYRNTMESLFFILDRIKSCSWAALDNMEQFFKGCNQYVLSRLELCRNNGLLSETSYEVIVETSKTDDLI